jgi:hypothetical protein
VDIRADIYSLGATFYFCLTGRTPFSEGTVAQKLIWHQTRQPKPLRALRPDVPEALAAVVERMMAKDAAGRYATPQEVADALAPFTGTPIPPPPDSEMPQFSPAVRGPTCSGETTQSNGPRTPSTNPSPAPRKAWQVPGPAQALSDSPPPRSTAPSLLQDTIPTTRPSRPLPAAPAPARDLRKSNPPPPAPPAPPAATNGTARPAPPPARTPERTPTVAAPAPSWENLALAAGGATARPGPPSETRKGAAARRRVPAPGAWGARRRVLWVVVGSAAGVVLLLLGLILWFVFGPSPKRSEAPAAPERPTFFVGHSRKSDGFPTLAAALARARLKPALGARILVQDDLAEHNVAVNDLANVSIEADEGRPVTWRPGPGPAPKLLTVNNADGFRLKGITLDGEGRTDALINLYRHCPGLVLEDLTLKGFTKYGVWVTNCEGGPAPDKHVCLRRISFSTAQPNQTAVFFDVLKHIQGIVKDRYFIVRDCSFAGPGAKVKTPDLSYIDQVELPAGVETVQGP